MSTHEALILPKILVVELRRFSLYTQEPNIRVQIPDGVFCLAGANGLGKSTFLAAVNFGLTGIVREHSRDFQSVDEFYKYSMGYSDQFFTGRITEEDRLAAEVSLQFEVGEHSYQITRGIFEPDELRGLHIFNKESNELFFDGEKLTPGDRQEEYKNQLTADVGLASFEQFVFLQHFVFTFDESRHLLLWDQPALNQALYLCMGTDYKHAQQADKLRREMEKAGSLARNYNWRASQVSKEIELLKKNSTTQAPEVDLEELSNQHQSLQKELEELQKGVETKQARFNDAQLAHMRLSSELTTVQNEYEMRFSEYANQHSSVETHPLINETFSAQKCALCGAEGSSIVQLIKRSLDNKKCPLCGSDLSTHTEAIDMLVKLQEIDERINSIKEQLKNASRTRERVADELHRVESARATKLEKLEEFEKANEDLLYYSKNENELDAAIRNKLELLRDMLRRKKEKYAERDKKKQKYLGLQQELQDAYTVAQMKFVPSFRELAELFLGIDLDIHMNFSKSVSAPGVSLTLEMRGSVRRQEQQLSESQRFFLDIALRMALAEYAVQSLSSGASLFIDTPEGSLDIAYESRVGQMFARFAQKRHNIIMTANINSSQILQRLASVCGHSKMTLHEMRFWTELSEVQMEEAELFQKALREIEEAFDSTEK